MSEGKNLVKVEFNEIAPTPFKPEYLLEDAVTRMIAAYNAVAGSKGKPQIIAGDVIRVRVFYDDTSKKREFSSLDRLLFNGVEAGSPFNEPEVKRVGDFARLRQNPDGTFAENSLVYLQIATYRSAEGVVKRDTAKFKAEGIATDAPTSFDGWLQ